MCSIVCTYTNCYDAKLTKSFLSNKLAKIYIVKLALHHGRDRKHVCSVVRLERRSKSSALAKVADFARNKGWGEQWSLREQGVRTLCPRVAQCSWATGTKLSVGVFKPLTKQTHGYVWFVFRYWYVPRNRSCIKSLRPPRSWGMAARAAKEALGMVVKSAVFSKNQWSNGTPQNNQWMVC